jgi:hypothetical protein
MYINSIAIQAVVERAKSKGTLTMLDYDFMKKENEKEYQFIQEVIEGSRGVLATAVTLAEVNLLRYCPVRVFISITSACIFLLKAISLGTRQSELEKSLKTLEKCIQALRYHTHDDMHLSSRYGTLLARHVRKFKRNFKVRNLPQERQTATLEPSAGNSPLPISQTRPDHQNLNGGGQLSMSDWPATSDLEIGIDDWLAQPFDPSFAPFDFDINQAASGVDMNALDFLWNLPT